MAESLNIFRNMDVPTEYMSVSTGSRKGEELAFLSKVTSSFSAEDIQGY